MFRFATVQDWWDQTRDPELLFLRTPQWCGAALKNIGSAFVASQVKAHMPRTVLEFGHGDGSALFDLFGQRCELWGIDDVSPHFPPPPARRFPSQA